MWLENLWGRGGGFSGLRDGGIRGDGGFFEGKGD